MTLRQKYPSLSNSAFVKGMVVKTVYNTMQLEGQAVSKNRVKKLYARVKKEQAGRTLK